MAHRGLHAVAQVLVLWLAPTDAETMCLCPGRGAPLRSCTAELSFPAMLAPLLHSFATLPCTSRSTAPRAYRRAIFEEVHYQPEKHSLTPFPSIH